MRKILILLYVLVVSGCSIYQIHVPQGNAVDAAKVKQLQLGMSKQQVRFLLGTAMLQDTFHQDRWDYLYRLERGGTLLAASTLTLFFDNDQLKRIDDSRYEPDAIPKP